MIAIAVVWGVGALLITLIFGRGTNVRGRVKQGGSLGPEDRLGPIQYGVVDDRTRFFMLLMMGWTLAVAGSVVLGKATIREGRMRLANQSFEESRLLRDRVICLHTRVCDLNLTRTAVELVDAYHSGGASSPPGRYLVPELARPYPTREAIEAILGKPTSQDSPTEATWSVDSCPAIAVSYSERDFLVRLVSVTACKEEEKVEQTNLQERFSQTGLPSNLGTFEKPLVEMSINSQPIERIRVLRMEPEGTSIALRRVGREGERWSLFEHVTTGNHSKLPPCLHPTADR